MNIRCPEVNPGSDAACLPTITRPMYLRPDSVFGVFVRRLRAALDGSSFTRLSAVYEDVVSYSASLRGDDNERVPGFVLGRELRQQRAKARSL